MSRPCRGPVPGRIMACGRPCRGRVVGLADRVTAHAWPCCSARPAVSRAMSQRPHEIYCTYRNFLRRIVALPLVVSRPYQDTTQRPSRVPVTIRPFVSRHSPPTVRPSRAGCSPFCVGRPCRRPCWPSRGPAMAVSSPAMSWPPSYVQANLPALRF